MDSVDGSQLSGAAPVQTALTWEADGRAVIRAEPPQDRKRFQRGLRGDARRAAEYIATRGATPLEQLHNIARMSWRKAVVELSRGCGCTRPEAFRLWVAINESLLPYVNAKLASVELTGDAAVGGLALAHFLAAGAFGDRLAGAESRNHQICDMPKGADNQRVMELLPDGVTRPGLPPRAAD